MEKTGYTSENLKVLRGLDVVRNRPDRYNDGDLKDNTVYKEKQDLDSSNSQGTNDKAE